MSQPKSNKPDKKNISKLDIPGKETGDLGEWDPSRKFTAEEIAKVNEDWNKPEKKTAISTSDDKNEAPEMPDVKPKYDKRRPREVIDPRVQIQYISQLLLNSTPTKYGDVEMEVKFGTQGIKQLTKADYDNVIKKLQFEGFRCLNMEGLYTLKIQLEFIDIKTGQHKISNDFDRYRVEINGLTNIQEYCKTGNIQQLFETKPPAYVSIMRKMNVIIDEKPVYPADFSDFNYRVTYKNEEKVGSKGKQGQELVSNWDKSKKQFRYINRVTFIHPNYPFKIDLSIVKSSTRERGQLIKTYNIADSNVFNNYESYEIEIETINLQAKQLFRTPKELIDNLQRIIKFVLCGLQKTNYPVSYIEQKQIVSDYLRVIHEEEMRQRDQEYIPKDRAYPNDFIGYSSKTLQIKNIAPVNPDMVIPNITDPYSYCVTDKADGDRHLMFINNKGKIYLINMNMDVIFTGAKTEQQRCFNSVIDGELILHDKNGVFINIFAAFDIYFASHTDLRFRPFVEVPFKNTKIFKESCRLPVLKEFMKILDPVKNIQGNSKKDIVSNKSPMTFISKNFYPRFENPDQSERGSASTSELKIDLSSYNIFEACNYILRQVQDNLFNYTTDGLIFTPTLLGVGGNKILEAGPLKKIRWDYSFKWKPSKFNTIDFLVSTKKGPDNQDIVTPIFENGLNVHQSRQYNQYKTVILQVGFDEKKHGYINPCQDILDDKLPEVSSEENEDKYRKEQFYPSDPFDPQAGLCNIMLQLDDLGNPQMFTEERQVFDDNMVVEFRYDLDREGLWKWIPLRVRYDKTALLRNGKISCNDYETANNNWYSIHNPITERMITTGQDIPSEILSDEIYYNRVTNEKLTMGLRDFHNLYVKKLLIRNVSRNGNILIDFACGKGGDMPKWISANLSFVFGIDISKDNIENRIGGACARYLSYRKEFKTMPYALFVCGNSSLNIRSGKAMYTDKGNSITQSVFGIKALDKQLGPGVARQYAKGENGFDISSCQFAIHYMFENKHTFYNFIRNVAECTKEGGYFIGTCYDGKTVFNRLKMKPQGDGETIYYNDKKIWSITKDYDAVSFDDNISSLGYKISVYQESINQTFPEYLVNFDFLVKTMEDYGFRLLPREDAKKIGLPEGSGMFIEMYNKMMDEITRFPKNEKEYKNAPFMRDYEKRISFLNRYFVFQKIATRNVEKLTKSILEQLPDEIEFEDRQSKIAQETVKKVEKELKPKVKNLRKKIMLQEATEVFEESKSSNKEPDQSVQQGPVEAVEHIVEQETFVPVVVPAVKEKKVVKPRKTKKILGEETVVVGNVVVEPATTEKKKATRKKKVEFDIL
jgi:hypothetical protein